MNPDGSEQSPEDIERISKEIERMCDEDCNPKVYKTSIGDQIESRGLCEEIRNIILCIGDDPDREGLRDTPNRVAYSYNEIFAGYKVDVGLMMTQFDSESYSEMVILEGIEFFSMCEHHMLPFYGSAWVAYVPHKKIVGISKLARLVDAYARRLQNQERITMQVTQAIDDHLDPMGAACVIKAKHMCMGCRGVKQPHTIMTTSSLTGVFLEDPQTRMEFLSFVNGR